MLAFFRYVNFTSFGGTIQGTLFYVFGSIRVYYENCIFSHFDFNFTGSYRGMFVIRYTSRQIFINCTFYDINCTNNYPILFYGEGTYSFTLNISGTTFKNIIHNGNSTSLGSFCRVPGLKLTAINNTFISCSSPNGFKGGVFYLDNNSNITFNLTQCTFTNIENGGDGGVIYTNCPTNYTITSCIFENCSSSGGKGGAIYINNTGIFTYIQCRFLNNSGNSGGNDIDHSTDLSTSYSSYNFVRTCSLSESPRVYFSGGGNVDNLLLGL
jgi:hypothetical protein